MKNSLGEISREMPNEQRAINGIHNNIASTSGTSPNSVTNGSNVVVEPNFDSAYVKIIAESIGITDLPDSCANLIATSITYQLKDVIEQSKKLMSHARRKRLIADDIDGALMLKRFQPLFGFTSKDGLPFRYVGSCGRDLFIVDDHDVEITPIVNATAPRLPAESALKAHWLVVDGEQPAVPENPTPGVIDELSSSAVTDMQIGEAGPSIYSQTGKTLRKTEQVQIKTVTTHALSVEQQVYFKEITEAVMCSDEARRTEALQSLQTDAGLQPLLPRFSLTIVEGVRCNIAQRNLAILIYLMRMVQSIAANQSLSLDRNLHEFVPTILSCILSKQLCIRPDADNHWVLREFASRILASICRSYDIDNLRSRVARVLTSGWLYEQVTMPTLYGSIYALNELGVDTVRAVVLPYINHLFSWIVREMKSVETSETDRLAAEKTYHLLVKVLINYVKIHRPAGLKDLPDYNSQFGGFGDAIYSAMSKDSPPISSSPSNSLNSLNTNSFSKSRLITERKPTSLHSRAPTASILRNSIVRPSNARPQISSIIRNSNLTSTNRPQSNQNSSLSGYYSSNTSNQQGGYFVKTANIKRMILPQRASSSSSSDTYQNM